MTQPSTSSTSTSVVKRIFTTGLKTLGGTILVLAALGLLLVAIAIVMMVAAFLIVGLAGFMLAMPDKSQSTLRLLARSIQTGTQTLKQLVEEAGQFYLKMVASFQGASQASPPSEATKPTAQAHGDAADGTTATTASQDAHQHVKATADGANEVTKAS